MKSIHELLRTNPTISHTSRTLRGLTASGYVIDEYDREWLEEQTRKLVLSRVGKKRFVARYEGTRKVHKVFIGGYPKAKREFIVYQVTQRLLKD